MACPKCHLPVEESAWYCDGCGLQFSQDIDGTRARLRAELKRSHTTLWVTLLVDVAVVGVVVYLASIGFYYISAPIGLAVIGSIGHAFHRKSVMRDHMRTFERRYPELPTAAVHHRPS